MTADNLTALPDRAAFERWMIDVRKCVVGSSDPYPAGMERDAWQAWQAGAAYARALLAARDAERGDAARWRALIGGRVRVLGSAGLHSELSPHGEPWNGYAHIGVELWTKHGTDPDPEAVEWFTKYADTAVAALQADAARAEGESDGR